MHADVCLFVCCMRKTNHLLTNNEKKNYERRCLRLPSVYPLSAVDDGLASKVLLVDTVSQRFRNGANDGSSHLAGGHVS